MPRVRLSPSASVTPTPKGVLLRSDLGTFEIGGADVGAFLEAIVPLLDGSWDRDEIAGALDEFSPRSVLALLDLLEKKGLLEAVFEEDARLDERWRGQEDFFRKWARSPEPMARTLTEARVLLVGLSPWGAAAAGELAASGVGRIDVLDTGEAGEFDPSPRKEAFLKALAEVSPWCRATVTPLAWTVDSEIDAGARRIASAIVIPFNSCWERRRVMKEASSGASPGSPRPWAWSLCTVTSTPHRGSSDRSSCQERRLAGAARKSGTSVHDLIRRGPTTSRRRPRWRRCSGSCSRSRRSS